MLVNILALIYGGVMIINFLWFGGLRNIYTNPVMGSAFPSLANIPLLGGIPSLSSHWLCSLALAPSTGSASNGARLLQAAKSELRRFRTSNL